jgi:hypothetical protein
MHALAREQLDHRMVAAAIDAAAFPELVLLLGGHALLTRERARRASGLSRPSSSRSSDISWASAVTCR